MGNQSVQSYLSLCESDRKWIFKITYIQIIISEKGEELAQPYVTIDYDKSYLGSLTSPLDLTVSSLEKSNSRSVRF